MTEYNFILDRTCVEGEFCPVEDEIISKFLEIDATIKLRSNTEVDTVHGHISISHQPNNHKIWVFMYDVNGTHQSADSVTNEIITISNSRVMRFSKTRPSLNSVKARFTGVKT